MCKEAPAAVYELENYGLPFSRTDEGGLCWSPSCSWAVRWTHDGVLRRVRCSAPCLPVHEPMTLWISVPARLPAAQPNAGAARCLCRQDLPAGFRRTIAGLWAGRPGLPLLRCCGPHRACHASHAVSLRARPSGF